MTGFQLNFDATNIAPDTGFETVPAGWYNVRVDESDMKPTKDGSGAYLQLRFDIIDGQFIGRKLFARFNLKNSSQQAVEIAFKQLSAVAHAVNVLRIGNSQELHGIPLKVKVKVRKDSTGQYEDSNDIISYKNINEPVDMAGGGAPPVQGGFAGGFQQQAAPQQPAFQQPNPIGQQGFSGGQSPGFSQPQGQQPWANAPAAGIAQQAPQQQQGPWAGDPGQQQPQQAAQPAQQQFQQQPQPQQFQQPQGEQPWAQNGGGQPDWAQQPQQQQPQQGQPQGQPQQQAQQPQQQHPAQSAAPPWAQQG
jgi:hypothetical protein